MSNDHKDYCTYMNTEPVFPLGSKVWGVGRTCDFCGDSRLLRAGAGSIEENNTSWVDIWEDDGRWDQVDPSGTEISTFLGDLEEAEKGWCVWYCLVIMRSGSICLIESFNLSPRRRRCSPFLVKYRLAATIRRDPSLPQICTPPVNHPIKSGCDTWDPLSRTFPQGPHFCRPKTLLELQEEARFAMVAALQMMSIGGMQLGKFTGVCCFLWNGSKGISTLDLFSTECEQI